MAMWARGNLQLTDLQSRVGHESPSLAMITDASFGLAGTDGDLAVPKNLNACACPGFR
jgi:hypothetical protein